MLCCPPLAAPAGPTLRPDWPASMLPRDTHAHAEVLPGARCRARRARRAACLHAAAHNPPHDAAPACQACQQAAVLQKGAALRSQRPREAPTRDTDPRARSTPPRMPRAAGEPAAQPRQKEAPQHPTPSCSKSRSNSCDEAAASCSSKLARVHAPARELHTRSQGSGRTRKSSHEQRTKGGAARQAAGRAVNACAAPRATPLNCTPLVPAPSPPWRPDPAQSDSEAPNDAHMRPDGQQDAPPRPTSPRSSATPAQRDRLNSYKKGDANWGALITPPPPPAPPPVQQKEATWAQLERLLLREMNKSSKQVGHWGSDKMSLNPSASPPRNLYW